ncbi:flippase [Denitrificimonas sp. JX-1]|uniref:Flippase n=1 Tax=Denitrificimonas halotolerans TaxID=3098930 RepID=A0ABU5GSV1_9GAMM|nr:flippase [Denitrificimonas sp. JX-1]MDY7219435.1 flippase [Denitrificimonas sp. JX-1]
MNNPIKALWARVQGTRDGRALASNFGYLLLLQVASYIFPLLTIPYLARVIGVDGFGKIAFAAAVVMGFRTLADWGFNFTATRDVARHRDNPEKVAEIFSNVLWARLLLMLLSLLLLLGAIAVVPYFQAQKNLLLITFLLVPGHILFPAWFFQAMERMKYITLFDLLSKALFTALIFIFIKEKSDYMLQPLFLSLGYMFTGMGAMYVVLVQWQVRLKAPRWSAIYRTIHSSTDVFINNLMPNLYTNFSVMLLGFMGGSVANGLLDAGSKFANIAQQLMTVLSRVFFPFLSRKSEKHSLYLKINLVSAGVCALGLLLTAPVLVPVFFTPEFAGAVPVLQILAVSIVFLALSNAYGTHYMIIKGHEKQLKNITIGCSLVGFIAAFPLIYTYGHIGAALTIACTRVLLGVTVSYTARRIIRQGYEYECSNT